MTEPLDIRKSNPGDVAAIEDLYPQAFPDEDLLPLVRQLLVEDPDILSLVAIAGNDLAGHIIFTTCGIVDKPDRVALLGPLAVTPFRQRQGLGGALIGDGLQRLKKAGLGRVCVLGDPAYYGRFGFTRDDGIEPPYPLPEEWHSAWQSLDLKDKKKPTVGKLFVPPPWRQRALWEA